MGPAASTDKASAAQIEAMRAVLGAALAAGGFGFSTANVATQVDGDGRPDYFYQASLLYQGTYKGLVLGDYAILDKIGAGGMAEVYKARMSGEQGFEKIVAIKRIVPHMATNAEFVTMFVDEAKLAAQLNHNNITHIYDLGKVDAWHYIAMEYVEGKDLRTLLKLAKERDFPLPAECWIR